jgi:hypothetical protein
MILKRTILNVFLLCLLQYAASAQFSGSGGFNRMGAFNGGGKTGNAKGTDSLRHRDKNEDSITIYYKLFNNNDIKKLDTSINDFFVHMPYNYTVYNLGNLGTATKSYLFKPIVQPGFDAGFHSYENYNYTLEETPLFQTTRPYTELGYLLGGKAEQLIEIRHTQNRKQQLNFSFDFRFTNAPGNLKNQNSNFNNMRVTAHFQSKRKRYESYFIMLNNQTSSSENGGLINANLLDSLALNNPYELETRLGQSTAAFRNPFNTNISTGSVYKDNTLLWRQSYDLGQKDSVVKDTITTYLFYPRLRFQNEIKYQTKDFLFQDAVPDSLKYDSYFHVQIPVGSTVLYQDSWNILTDEFSLISYPQKNNSNQFLQVGMGYQNMQASFYQHAGWNNNDTYGLGHYKNKTRNQVWDLDLSGKLFLNGYHAGDYQASFSLFSLLNKKGNYVQLGFNNSNRTPSSNFQGLNGFPIIAINGIKKENIIQLSALTGNNKTGWKAMASYQLINNYHYFTGGLQSNVYSSAISYIQGQLQNKFKLSTHWNWYSEMHLQIVDQASPIHVPLILTRQRLAFEGVFYKNLNLSTGLEFIYHTGFKADNYMPLSGQFFVQNGANLTNRPTTNAYLNFMIKRFKAYVRVENLNTLLPTSRTYGNTYNFTAANYPGTGTWVRLGIWWNFIN